MDGGYPPEKGRRGAAVLELLNRYRTPKSYRGIESPPSANYFISR